MFILKSLQNLRFQEVWFDICILLVVDNVLLTCGCQTDVTKNRHFRRLFSDVMQICFMSDTVKHTVSTHYKPDFFFNVVLALRFLTLGLKFLYHYFN